MTDRVVATARTLAEASPLSVGALFADRYEIGATVGEGGMGAVYRALDRELDEEVALKVLLPELAARRDALLRFRREVKLARRVTHPNVARTYDLGTWQGTRFLTMELIVGESLSMRMSRDTISMPEALRTASEIAKGLGAAHAVGVVHRDLKPDNVMIAGERIVLTDFGISVLAEGLDSGALRTGAIVGTPAYMAPEQLEGRSVDGRTDVYALGIVLYELLTRTAPFPSGVPGMAARIGGKPRDPRELAPHLPEGVAELILAALEPKRESRLDAATLLRRIEVLRGAGDARVDNITRAPSISFDSGPTRSTSRTVAVNPFDAPADLEGRANDLTRAVSDALSHERGVKVAASSATADLVVEGSVRASGPRVRARMRLTDVHTRASAWTDVVDGSDDDWFSLEDMVVAHVRDAVQGRVSQATAGPSDPAVRAIYERANDSFEKFSLVHIQAAIVDLEKLHIEFPDEPHIASLLSAALVRSWTQTGGVDAAVVARAEDLALRALDTDPSIGLTYMTLAHIRGQSGELQAAMRCAREAIARAPRLADAHIFFGVFLWHTQHTADGLRRLELAQRIEPRSLIARGHRALALALLGDRPQAEALVREAIERGGPTALIHLESRLAVWWTDADYARDIAFRIEEAKSGASWDQAAPILREAASGAISAATKETLWRMTSARAAPRTRTMMHEIAAEYLAWGGETEEAMAHIEALALLPFVNLEWLDRCPNLAPMRADPRFARVRAVTATRANELWQ